MDRIIERVFYPVNHRPGVGDHAAPNHTVLATQRSFVFEQEETELTESLFNLRGLCSLRFKFENMREKIKSAGFTGSSSRSSCGSCQMFPALRLRCGPIQVLSESSSYARQSVVDGCPSSAKGGVFHRLATVATRMKPFSDKAWISFYSTDAG